MRDFAVSELRRLDVYLKIDGNLSESPVSYYMHRSQTNSCIKSILKYHYIPNIKCLPEVMYIMVGKFYGGLLGWSFSREWTHPEIRRKEAETKPEIIPVEVESK